MRYNLDCVPELVKANVSRNRQIETSCEEVVIRDEARLRARKLVAQG